MTHLPRRLVAAALAFALLTACAIEPAQKPVLRGAEGEASDLPVVAPIPSSEAAFDKIAAASFEDLRVDRARLIKASATGNALSTSPQLRLELGMHGAAIRDLKVSKDGRWAATASLDKTVRIWRVPDLEGPDAEWRLDNVLRIPIGPGNEGKAYAVAIHPEGRWVAVGGWFSGDDGQSSVYVFERISGDLVKRLALPQADAVSVTQSLAFSDDGGRLAAGWEASERLKVDWATGVRIWNSTADPKTGLWPKQTDLDGVNDSPYGLDYSDTDDRLAVSTFDGYVRLYDEQGGILFSRDLDRKNEGAQPKGIAFSPSRKGEARLLAVGFDNQRRLEILSGEDLSQVASGNSRGISHVSELPVAGSVAWSADGSTIYSGGKGFKYKDGYPMHVVRAFDRDGDIRWTTPTSLNSITGLGALPGGRVVFASKEPSIGLLGASGREGPDYDPSKIDFRNALRPTMRFYFPLRVSADGRMVSLPFSPPFYWRNTEKPHLEARVGARAVHVKAEAAEALRAPRLSAGRTSVKDWYRSERPVINGKKVQLIDRDLANAAAVSDDGRRVVVATALGLYRYRINRRGGAPIALGHVETPGVGWRINLSADGSLIIAAFSDGAIRWYNFETGELLLSLFVTPDQDAPEWVYWTPQGYFVASPDAEDLLIWNVNRNANTPPLVYPLSKFSDRYYRPDVIERVLAAGDVQIALNQANSAIGAGPEKADADLDTVERLPPVATILSPENGTEFQDETVTLRVRVEAPGGGAITGVRTLRNGKDWPAARQRNPVATIKSGSELEFLYTGLPRNDARLSIEVLGEDGVSVRDDGVLIKYSGDRPPVALERHLKAVVVGVSDYKNADIDLDYADDDAEQFADVLRSTAVVNGFVNVDIEEPILNNEATESAIENAIDRLAAKLNSEEDVGVLFLAGHGFTDRKENGYYFMPHDWDPEYPRSNVVPAQVIQRLVRDSGQASVIIVIDACRSGEASRRELEGFDNDRVVGVIRERADALVITSAQADEQAFEFPEPIENGIFTEHLIEAVLGDADRNKDGLIKKVELQSYLTETVGGATDGKQNPRVYGELPDQISRRNPIVFRSP